MAHKPNYIPADAGNFTGYDPTVYRPQAGDENLKVDDTDSRFQISIKTPLAWNLFDTLDIYTTYTKRSLWQVYNSEGSAPSRETNHEPETWTMISSRAPCLGT